jgi:hypothetical protein
MFRSARELFTVLRITATPIVIAFLAAIVLGVPAQVVEVYRIIALDTLALYLDREQLIIRYGSIAALILLSICCYVACTSLLGRFAPKLNLETWLGRATVNWVPFVVGVAPLAGIALGFFSASSPLDGTIADDEIRSRIAHELAYRIGIDDPSPAMLAGFQGQVDGLLRSLDTRLLQAMAAAIAIGIALLFALHVARGFVARSPLGTRVTVHRGLLGLCFALMIAAFIGFTVWPTAVPLAIGPIVIICLFFVLLLVGFGTLSFLSQEMKFPFTFLVLMWMAGLSIAGCNENDEIRYMDAGGARQETAAEPVPLPSLEECFKVWFETRPDRAENERFSSGDEKYPVYIVAAQGGGIFAAHHTAVFLAGVQQRVPQFQHHLFAISGVSGGSVGSAVFASALDLEQVILGKPESSPGKPCSPDPAELPRQRDPTASKFNIVDFVDDEVLSSDLLSPLIGAMAFPDFVQRFIPRSIPAFDRARALEYGLQDAWDAAAREQVAENDRFSAAIRARVSAHQDLLKSAYVSHWHASGSVPALLINTTEVATGRRQVFSPFTFDDGEVRFFKGEVPNRASLVTAAVLSARFPWITPAGWIGEGRRGLVSRFVDGGYFENSGIATALQLYEAIRNLADHLGIADRIAVKIIALTDDPDENRDGEVPSGFNELADPIRALLSTWSTRGRLSLRDAERRLNRAGGADNPLMRVTLKSIRHPLPLGWMISYVTRRLILIQRGDPKRCTEERRQKQTSTDRAFDADCVVAEIIREIGPQTITKAR